MGRLRTSILIIYFGGNNIFKLIRFVHIYGRQVGNVLTGVNRILFNIIFILTFPLHCNSCRSRILYIKKSSTEGQENIIILNNSENV